MAGRLLALLVVGLAPALAAEGSRLPAVPVNLIDTDVEAGAAVRRYPAPADRIGAAVLWPSPGELEGLTLPPGTALAAAHAALAQAAGSLPVEPFVVTGSGGLAVGASALPEDEDRLVELMDRLARPQPLSEGAAEIGLARAALEARQLALDPLAQARASALAALFAPLEPLVLELSEPEALEGVTPAALEGVLRTVRRRKLQAVAVGEPELASRLRAALAQHLGPAATGPEPRIATDLPAGIALPLPPAENEPPRLALVLGFAFSAEEVRELGDGLPLLYESLRIGEGSLAQRLGVALEDAEGVESRVELVPVGGGAGALLLEAIVPPDVGLTAWRVMSGTAESLASLTLREDAVIRAWRRLYRADDRADGIEARVRQALLPPLAIDEPNRLRGRGGRMVREAAEQVFGAGRRTAVAAGVVPAGLLSLDGFEEAELPEPVTEAAREAVERREEAAGLAREVLLALSSGRRRSLEPVFRARYRVTEETPVGEGQWDMTVERANGDIWYGIGEGRWSLQVEQAGDTGEAVLPGMEEAAIPFGGGHLELMALREPAILAAAILAGQLDAEATRVPCGAGSCPALVARLPDGSVLRLALDPRSRMPRRLLAWWYGDEAGRDPDEQVSFVSWRRAGDVQVCSRCVIEDVLGTERRLELLEWQWRPSAAADEP
jgi:hypothetical protein